MNRQTFQFTVPATLRLSAMVRNIAEEIFCMAGFSKSWCSRLKLVVDELFMNAVKYGSTEMKSKVEIEIFYDDTDAGFMISDDGTGTQPMSVKELRATIAANADHNQITSTHGRGLALIANLWTDGFTIDQGPQGGIRVSFTKKIVTTNPPPPPLTELAVGMHVPAQPPAAEEKPKGPAVTVRLQALSDQYNIEELFTPVFERAQSMPEGSALTLDLSEVDYINSTFVGHLAQVYNVLSKKHGTVTLAKANKEVRDVLDIVGLGRVMTLTA
ncbi:ATP-binding protein [Candidatus Peregrinibacteria bacterium]|nr:ATP-binding protein [Candidatus Peregrinibacteria bacterium]